MDKMPNLIKHIEDPVHAFNLTGQIADDVILDGDFECLPDDIIRHFALSVLYQHNEGYCDVRSALCGAINQYAREQGAL